MTLPGWRYTLPLAVFAALAAAFALYLYQISFEGRVVSNIPSALIDEPVPTCNLPPMEGRDQIGRAHV